VSAVASLELLPDVERIVVDELRANAAVAAIAADRIFTTWPKSRDDVAKSPVVIVTRTGGAPPFSRPLRLDSCELQIDTYGGGRGASWQLTATVLDALVELTDRVSALGVLHGVTIVASRFVPDESFAPARPRYVTDVTVTASPPRSSARLIDRSLVASRKE